jgi:hypothetical protein
MCTVLLQNPSELRDHDNDDSVIEAGLEMEAEVSNPCLISVNLCNRVCMSDPVCGECVLASAATALSQTVFQLDRKAVLRHGKSLATCGQLPRRNTSTHLSHKHCPNSMTDDPVYYVGMTTNAKKQQHKVVSERVRVLTRNMHRDLDKCDFLS